MRKLIARRRLRMSAIAAAPVVALSMWAPAALGQDNPGSSSAVPAGVPVAVAPSAVERVRESVAMRLTADMAAIEAFRPGYRFWQHIFSVPDGSVAFGSAADGRLLAVFPAGGDWTRGGRWVEPGLDTLLRGRPMPPGVASRRDEVARLLDPVVGPVMHNPTRGRFLLRNVPSYGSFVRDWGAIYERFGVPAEVGLAQAIVESGLNGTVRSEAKAVGFCQWLEGNWNRLKKLTPHVIEAQNQTTQAPYCAAYLSVLATKYGSFLPALSEHHAGGTNVGRVLVHGSTLGGDAIRAKYLLGSEFALALRELSPQRYSELYRTYGPRSFRYTELVFGNLETVTQLMENEPQTRIHAMRTTRGIPIAEVARRSGLSTAEVKRYNPALVRQVPARATLYLPMHVAAFGADVAFWHRPASAAFAETLADFLALDASPEEWDEPPFQPVLRDYQQRFRQTGTEEGLVMAVVLAYVAEEARTSRRGAILREFRTSPRVASLLEQAVRETAATPATVRNVDPTLDER